MLMALNSRVNLRERMKARNVVHEMGRMSSNQLRWDAVRNGGSLPEALPEVRPPLIGTNAGELIVDNPYLVTQFSGSGYTSPAPPCSSSANIFGGQQSRPMGEHGNA